MKLLLVVASLISVAYARSTFGGVSHIPAFASVAPSSATSAKDYLLTVANRVAADSKTGVFITNPKERSELKKAVAELEAVGGPPTAADFPKYVGDWKLVCTAVATRLDDDEESRSPIKMPFNLPSLQDVAKHIQDAVRRSFVVTQRIRCTDENNPDEVDRVDNIIEYMPPKTLQEIFGNDTPFGDADLNPLDVTRSSVVLHHKASVESMEPVWRTKLALESVVLNVAGKSQLLEPKGKDILGVNVPLGDFLNAGYFDTTYLDDDLRISRGKVGPVNQLRVFVRKAAEVDVEDMDEISGSDENTQVVLAEVVEMTEEEDDITEDDEDEVEEEPYSDI